jgi:hypothetical protein
MKQTDYMRELVRRLGSDRVAVCSAFAKAERDGIVQRRSNKYALTPEQYADRLWKNGVYRGWLNV